MPRIPGAPELPLESDESPESAQQGGETPVIDRRKFLRGIGAVGAAAAGVPALERLAPEAHAAEGTPVAQQAPTYAIHPALGVARMGNATPDMSDPSSFYLAGESPYEVPNHGQPYKVDGHVKKQAQRFRIYEYDAEGNATKEITLADPEITNITWTVHLANRKSAFDPSKAPGSVSRPAVLPRTYTPARVRNPDVPAADRGLLAIDPGEVSVDGAGNWVDVSGGITLPDANGNMIRRTKSVGGQDVEDPVTLGHLYTEDSGRLLVFASEGLSEGLLDGQYSSFAPMGPNPDDWVNNNGWHDSSADGSIKAEITFADGRTVSVDQPNQAAWVICACPRYAPGLTQFTSVYDVAASAFYTSDREVARPSFRRDIFPILRSAAQLTFVSARASLGHSQGRGGYYLSKDLLDLVGSNGPEGASMRARVFSRIRNPENYDITDETAQDMPRLPMQVIQEPNGNSEGMQWDIGAVTPLQYAQLQKWMQGDFDADGVPEYVPFGDLDLGEQPDALDRAALEATCGTPFFPGIETWGITRERRLYADAPLRMSAEVYPGDLTICNAVPWQADYLDCTDAWWPIQRPTEVTRNGVPVQPWVPADWGEHADEAQYGEMVRHWWQLGFIVSKDDGATYEETERQLEGKGS